MERRKYEQAEYMLARYNDELILRQGAAWVLEQSGLSQLWAYQSPDRWTPYHLFITWQREKGEFPRVPVGKLRCHAADLETGPETRILREDSAHEWQELVVARPIRPSYSRTNRSRSIFVKRKNH
jgi:hypothetical protein